MYYLIFPFQYSLVFASLPLNLLFILESRKCKIWNGKVRLKTLLLLRIVEPIN